MPRIKSGADIWIVPVHYVNGLLSSVLAAVTKPAVHSVTLSPCALKNNVKKEDEGKVEDNGLLPDQLVPDYAARLVIGPCSFCD